MPSTTPHCPSSAKARSSRDGPVRTSQPAGPFLPIGLAEHPQHQRERHQEAAGEEKRRGSGLGPG